MRSTAILVVALALAGCSFPDVGFTGAGGSGGSSTTTVAAGGGGGSASTVTTTTTTGGGGGNGTGGGGGGPNCIDADGDFYVAAASDANCLGLPPYQSTIDCDDDDADTHPDQLAWFSDPRPNGGTFDYDCSGAAETFYLIACDLTKPSLATGGVPGCGNTYQKKSAAAVCLDNGMAMQTCH